MMMMMNDVDVYDELTQVTKVSGTATWNHLFTLGPLKFAALPEPARCWRVPTGSSSSSKLPPTPAISAPGCMGVDVDMT